MSHSNSSLNCFATCMAKYKHQYVLHTPPDKPPSSHLTFGTMAHDVLYKAGVIRDEYKDGLPIDYKPVIPSEVLYPDLKTEFQINNWHSYFMPVIKQIAQYEKELCDSMEESYEIKREHRVQLSPDELLNNFGKIIMQPMVGVIDLLILGKKSAIIMDYKFSTERKTQADFDQNSQLYLYAAFVNILYGIPLRNIKVGYIDIPKKSFDSPTVLTNGTLSRSKSQNVSAEMYKKAVEAIHGKDDPVYNCEPGGHYYEIWCALQLNKAAYLSAQYLDEDAYSYIINDLITTANLIDKIIAPCNAYLRKYDSYSCKNCEFLKSCKPWLTVQGE